MFLHFKANNGRRKTSNGVIYKRRSCKYLVVVTLLVVSLSTEDDEERLPLWLQSAVTLLVVGVDVLLEDDD